MVSGKYSIPRDGSRESIGSKFERIFRKSRSSEETVEELPEQCECRFITDIMVCPNPTGSPNASQLLADPPEPVQRQTSLPIEYAPVELTYKPVEPQPKPRQSSSAQSSVSKMSRSATYAMTGADFMERRGWNERDAYGNPLNPTKSGSGRNVLRYIPHNASGYTEEKESSNMTYIVPIIVLIVLLVVIIISLLILFATGVLHLGSSQPPTPPPDNGNRNDNLPPKVQLVNRTFECEFYVLDQYNPAYNDPTSVEYEQASTIIRNALNTLIAQSTIRDLTPSLQMGRLANAGNDLHVPFRLTLIVYSNSQLTAESIKNVILSELTLLEAQLNFTFIDRTRVNVRAAS